MLATAVFWWIIVNRPVLFVLALPLSALGIAMPVLLIWAASVADNQKQDGWRRGLPILILVCLTGLAFAVPWDSLWLRIDAYGYHDARQRLVNRFVEQAYVPEAGSHRRSLTATGSTPKYSLDGDGIEIERHEGILYVCFQAFDGLFDKRSGWLYVSDGGAPYRFYRLEFEREDAQVVRRDANWYWIAHD